MRQAKENYFIDILNNVNSKQTIFEATRVTKTSKLLIDNIYVYIKDYYYSTNLESLLSDHNARMITIEMKDVPYEEFWETKRIFTKAKIQQDIHSLNEQSWQDLLEEPDPDNSHMMLSNIIGTLINLVFPLESIARRRTSNESWITTVIRTSNKNERKIYEDIMRGIQTEEYYRKYSSTLKSVVKLAKKKES